MNSIGEQVVHVFLVICRALNQPNDEKYAIREKYIYRCMIRNNDCRNVYQKEESELGAIGLVE